MPRQPGATEQLDRRTQHAKHWANPNGSRTAEFSAGMHWWNGSQWREKAQSFRAGPGTAEWISDDDGVTLRTYQVGQGGSRRWWVQFTETLSGDGIEFELRFQPTTTAGSNRLDFSDGAGGTWSYYHTRSGGKMLGASTPASQGPKTYTFTYRLLGNAPPLTLDADGSISCGTLFKMARPHLNGADGRTYAESSWTLGAGTLSFSYNDTSLPASAYPYRVDPSTTFNVAASADDKHIYRTGAAYPPAGTHLHSPAGSSLVMIKWLSAGTYYVYVGLVRFDTSSLAGAAVTGATLRYYMTTKADADNRDFVADWYTWNATTPTNADWTDTVGTDALPGTDITGLTLNADNDLVLSNAAANVSLTGYTYLRFGVSGGTPAGENRVDMAAFDHTTLTEPRLIVDYTDTTPPAAPTGLTFVGEVTTGD